MSKFKNKLEHLRPEGTAKYTLDGVHIPATNPKPVTLIGKFAGRANKAWWNAVVNAPESNEGGVRTADQADADDIESVKRATKYVITGWEDCLDESGKPYPYNPQDCADLLIEMIEKGRAEDVVMALAFFKNADRFCGKKVSAEALGNG